MSFKTIQILLFVLWCETPNLWAQKLSFGIQTGLTYNKLETKLDNLSLTKVQDRFGFSSGVFIKFLSKKITYAVNSIFITKNYAVLRTDSLTGEGDYYKNSYIQINYKIGIQIPVSAVVIEPNIGIYNGYWLAKKIRGSVVDVYGSLFKTYHLSWYQQNVPFKKSDNRLELGTALGINMLYVKHKYILSSEISSFYSVTDQQKMYTLKLVPRHNLTYSFILTFAFKL